MVEGEELMVEVGRADGKGGHGNRSHRCGFRSKKVGRAMSVVVIAAISHGNPAFGAGPWALCLVVLHTHARGEEVRSQSQCGRQRELPSTFLRDAIKSTAHSRLADIIGTLDSYPSPGLPSCPSDRFCIYLYCCVSSTYSGKDLEPSGRSWAAWTLCDAARGVVCPVWSPFLC